MKIILIVLCFLYVTSCSVDNTWRLNYSSIEKSQLLCIDNGGINYMSVSFTRNAVVCNNGIIFTLGW